MDKKELTKHAALVFKAIQTLPVFTPITIKGLLEEQGIIIPKDDVFEFMKALDSMIDFERTNSYHLYHGKEVHLSSFDTQTYINSSTAASNFALVHIVNSSITHVIELPIIRRDEIRLRIYQENTLAGGTIFPLSFKKWCELSSLLTQIMATQKPTGKVTKVNHGFLPNDMPSDPDLWILESVTGKRGFFVPCLKDIPFTLVSPFVTALKSIHPTMAKYCPEI